MTELERTRGEDRTLSRSRTRRVVFGIAFAVATATGASRVQATPNEVGSRAEPDESAKAAHKGAAFVDPLGFLLFGPTLGAELALGQFSVIHYFRWLNVGYLSESMFLNGSTKFEFSYGGGLKGRYYFQTTLEGPHFGVALELLKAQTKDNVNHIAADIMTLVPALEGGYRFAFGGYFLGGSASVGYAQLILKSVENIDGGDQAQYFVADDVSTIYGSASIDVGIYF